MTTEEFLTVAEVAAYLRVTPMTVYRLIHAKELTAVQVGRSFRVPRASLAVYVQRRTTGGDREAEAV